MQGLPCRLHTNLCHYPVAGGLWPMWPEPADTYSGGITSSVNQVTWQKSWSGKRDWEKQPLVNSICNKLISELTTGTVNHSHEIVWSVEFDFQRTQNRLKSCKCFMSRDWQIKGFCDVLNVILFVPNIVLVGSQVRLKSPRWERPIDHAHEFN